jgi:hypothetical protein
MKGKRAIRSKSVQLRNHGPVRSKQRKVGRSRKLGRLGVLDKRVRNNGKRYLGIPKITPEQLATMEDIYVFNDYPSSDYQRKYAD